MCADKRVRGSRGKLYRCDGAVFDVKSKAKKSRDCQALVRACWQSSTQEWKVTEVSYEHTLCSGGTKNASPRVLRAEAAKFINANTNMTAPSKKNSLKSQSGCGKLSGRSASRGIIYEFFNDAVIFVFELMNLAASARRTLGLAFLVPPEHSVCSQETSVTFHSCVEDCQHARTRAWQPRVSLALLLTSNTAPSQR